jgi:hypothetical protein
VANLSQLPQAAQQPLNEATQKTASAQGRRSPARKVVKKQDKILVKQVSYNRGPQPSFEQLELVEQEGLVHEFEDLLRKPKGKSVH